MAKEDKDLQHIPVHVMSGMNEKKISEKKWVLLIR
jgi:hypothetical protein